MMNAVYPWLSEAWERWKQQLEHQRFASATLINAPHGVGAEQLIEKFSQALMCTTQRSEPCGFCHGCELMLSATHPDYHLVRPEKEGKSITVEQIRIANRLAQESSQLSGFRLIVIEPAEAMNESAANALLKTLEEPAEKCVFILLTHQVSRLLATIVSRCQQIIIPEPQPQAVMPWLTEQCQQSIPAFAAHIHGNAPLLTRAFILQGELQNYLAIEQQFVQALQGDISSLLNCAKTISGQPLSGLRWLWYLLTDAQKTAFGVWQPYFTPQSQWLAQARSLSLLQQQTDSLAQLINQLQGFSGLNSELLIADWLFKFNEETCL